MFVKLFADGGLVAIILVSGAAGVYWFVKTKPDVKKLFPYVIMAGLTSLAFGKFISLLHVDEVRPFLAKGAAAGAAYIDNPGFPSDHALLATVVVMAVYFLTPYKKLSYGLMALTVIMCVARVFALVHTPLDILGGLVAGLVGTIWYIKLKHDIKISA